MLPSLRRRNSKSWGYRSNGNHINADDGIDAIDAHIHRYGHTQVPLMFSGLSIVMEREVTDAHVVALTFDDGAERGDAADILDILRDLHVVASFGVTGAWAEANPDLITRMVDDGHFLFSRGSTHQSWTGYSTATGPSDSSTWRPMSTEEQQEDLRVAEAIIAELTGVSIQPYFRPPYGGVVNLLGDEGYAVTLRWSCESLAWMGMAADEIVHRCSTDMVPGDIILLHVSDAGIDSEALPELIIALKDQGFGFVRVDDLGVPTF